MKKEMLCTGIGAVGGAIASFFGGWDQALMTLIIFMAMDYIRNAVIIGFMANELISIVENAGLMGIPLPAVIANAIDILTQKAEKKGDA